MNRRLISVFAAAATFLLANGAAHAASLTNSDEEAFIVQITIGGERSDVTVDAGKTVDICTGGCFMTLPNGELIALDGGESVTVKGGAATIE